MGKPFLCVRSPKGMWKLFGHGSAPLINSVKAKNIELVTKLLEAGANINAGDKNNWTALIWASHSKNLEMI